MWLRELTKCLLDGQMSLMVTAGVCPPQNSGGVEPALPSYCNLRLQETRGRRKRRMKCLIFCLKRFFNISVRDRSLDAGRLFAGGHLSLPKSSSGLVGEPMLKEPWLVTRQAAESPGQDLSACSERGGEMRRWERKQSFTQQTADGSKAQEWWHITYLNSDGSIFLSFQNIECFLTDF